jgi:acetyl-CoA C-acetyltransferase
MSTIQDRDVCVVGVARTPIGSYGGVFKDVPAVTLGATAIKAALQRANLEPNQVNEVYMGNVMSAGIGQAPARQAALAAGIPHNVPCTTVNKVCSSGMKATMIGAQMIQLGSADVVVTGGMENMSAVPYYNHKLRFGSRMGDVNLVDGMVKDGLWDPYNNCHMGEAAELCAKEYELSREAQDEYATASYQRAAAASNGGLFADEICPVYVKQRRGEPKEVKVDEEFTKVNFEKMKSLKCIFAKKGEKGTVTAGNASTLNDGAAALVLCSGAKAKELKLNVLFKIRSFADAAQEPERFTTAPSLAVPKALARGEVKLEEVDYWEVNEAFSAVALVNCKILNIEHEKVNVHGGAVALGHPLGCSGARIIITLLGVLKANKGTIGCAGVCNGGGGASAIVIERVDSSPSRL